MKIRALRDKIKTLAAGDNIIEFILQDEGTITYTCWMGMISSTITVVSDAINASANKSVSTNSIAKATINAGVQEVTIAVNNHGYSPAVIVLQKGVKAKIEFDVQQLNSCNNNVNLDAVKLEVKNYMITRVSGDSCCG